MTPDIATVLQTSVKALAFDVFGTVVDVRGSLIDELSAFGNRQHLTADWSAFADRWLAAYATGVTAVNNGQQPWQTVDVLSRWNLPIRPASPSPPPSQWLKGSSRD